MRFLRIKTAMLVIFQITGIYSSNSKVAIEKIKDIETILKSESESRGANYGDVIDKLDAINKILNISLEQNVSRDVSSGNIKHLQNEFTRNKTAFLEERTETARYRRELPKAENDFKAEWCLKSLNKSEELKLQMKQSDELLKAKIDLHFTKLNEEQSALQSTINNTYARVENLEMLVTKLAENLKHLFSDRSCKEFHAAGEIRTGVYTLQNGLDVFCDQTTDGGGWTVFQRRQNGEVDFYRNWTEYRNGFGDVNGEFWLGNELLSDYTREYRELRIDIEDFNGNTAHATYSKFKVHSEEEQYRLDVDGYSGNAKDCLFYHNGRAFTTFDNDNDNRYKKNCAKVHHGAWWYNSCQVSNLNGQYFNDSDKLDTKGINWRYWKNEYYCLKRVEMKVR